MTKSGEIGELEHLHVETTLILQFFIYCYMLELVSESEKD
jgi:hypothetical protein